MKKDLLAKERAERLATQARRSISEFCMNECGAYCCRKGILLMKEKEMKLLAGSNKKEMMAEGSLTVAEDGSFAMDMGKRHCPQLEGTKCSVWTHPDRPLTCEKFPVFVRESSIHFSPRCPAVRAGKFYAFEKEFMELGFDIE